MTDLGLADLLVGGACGDDVMGRRRLCERRQGRGKRVDDGRERCDRRARDQWTPAFSDPSVMDQWLRLRLLFTRQVARADIELIVCANES